MSWHQRSQNIPYPTRAVGLSTPTVSWQGARTWRAHDSLYWVQDLSPRWFWVRDCPKSPLPASWHRVPVTGRHWVRVRCFGTPSPNLNGNVRFHPNFSSPLPRQALGEDEEPKEEVEEEEEERRSHKEVEESQQVRQWDRKVLSCP